MTEWPRVSRKNEISSSILKFQYQNCLPGGLQPLRVIDECDCVWNRVNGLSSSHEHYKEKVAANIDGWMDEAPSHTWSGGCWQLSQCVLPELLAGVLRRVFISFMSLMLWIYMDSSRHTTSLCKTADYEQHYVKLSCIVHNIELATALHYGKKLFTTFNNENENTELKCLETHYLSYYSFSWKRVNYCNWIIVCCILTGDAWIQ